MDSKENLADRFVELQANGVLVLAAERGLILQLKCAMPICHCPNGREYFEKPYRGKGKPNDWATSPDHFPAPARDGGKLVASNVRLAHLKCNILEGCVHGARVRDARRASDPVLDEAFRQARREGVVKSNATQRRLRIEDPEYDKRFIETRRTLGHFGGTATSIRRRLDPEFDAYMTNSARVAGAAGVKVQAAMRKADPAFAALQILNMNKARCTRWSINRDKPCVCGQH